MWKKKKPRRPDLVTVFNEDWLNLTSSQCAKKNKLIRSLCASVPVAVFPLSRSSRHVVLFWLSARLSRKMSCDILWRVLTRLIFVLGCRQPDSGVGSIRSAAPPTMSLPLFQPCPKHRGRLDSVGDAFDSHSEFFRIGAQSVVCHIVTKLCPLQRFVFCFCFF